jgi:hypothetical protein
MFRTRAAQLCPPTAWRPQAVGNFPKSSTRFLAFAQACAAIASTSGKLEKVSTLAAFLRALSPDDLGRVTHWFTGIPFGATENKILSAGWALLRDALMTATGLAEADLRQVYLKHSDLAKPRANFGSSARRSGRRCPCSTWTRHSVASTRRVDPAQAAHPDRGAPALLRPRGKVPRQDHHRRLRIGLKEGLVEERFAGRLA